MNNWLAVSIAMVFASPSVALGITDGDITKALGSSSIDQYGFKDKLLACDVADAYFKAKIGDTSEGNSLMKSEEFRSEYPLLRSKYIVFTHQLKDRLKEPLTSELTKFFMGGIMSYLKDREKNEDDLVYVRTLCATAYIQFLTQAKSRSKQENPKQAINVLTQESKSENQQSSHSKCLEAKDYEGCMRVQSGQTSLPRRRKQDNCQPDKWCTASTGTDPLGKPKIEGWMMLYRPSKRSVVYRRPYAQKVNVRGKTNRYFQIETLLRYVVDPVSAIAPTSSTIGTERTNCTAGVGYTVNCTTTPPLTINTPGRAASPGGIVDSSAIYIYDCEERTVGFHINGQLKGKWKKPTPNLSRNFKDYCPIINSLETSRFDKYSE